VPSSDATRSSKAGKPKHGSTLPAIPDKLYFRIGEVARLLDLPPYVLRFWESEFPQLKPNKGGTGQRLYRKRDVEAVAEIRHLLYDEGYTIPGARQFLKERSRAPAPELPLAVEDDEANWRGAAQLRRVQTELREISRLLEQPSPGAPRANPVHRGLHISPRRKTADAPPPLFAVPKPESE
jgi:DNA-binding transcriptional MerR regulator